ncbi:MAG TPA: beta-1-3, beta-1-6-glucan biosynthesis protein [Bradyrhizobium sp.]|nr:beta-1-3, beta-1-6-glucan biosynthesis protein [Bradyrhizobium sp.]
MGQRVFGFQNGVLNRLLGRLAISGFALLIGFGSAFAQSGDLRTQDQSGKPAATNPATPADAAKDSQRKTDEFVEATQAINGPAGNPECVWLGRRVVVLMWRDDLDTAFRHLDLYDRFGCPGGHVQATFRCLVRFGAIDPKVPETLNGRVHACWINPGAQPQTAAAAQPAAPSTAGAASPATAGAAAPAAAPPPAAPAAAPAK